MWICGWCMVLLLLLLLRLSHAGFWFPCVDICMEGWGRWGKRIVIFLVAVRGSAEDWMKLATICVSLLCEGLEGITVVPYDRHHLVATRDWLMRRQGK